MTDDYKKGYAEGYNMALKSIVTALRAGEECKLCKTYQEMLLKEEDRSETELDKPE